MSTRCQRVWPLSLPDAVLYAVLHARIEVSTLWQCINVMQFKVVLQHGGRLQQGTCWRQGLGYGVRLQNPVRPSTTLAAKCSTGWKPSATPDTCRMVCLSRPSCDSLQSGALQSGAWACCVSKVQVQSDWDGLLVEDASRPAWLTSLEPAVKQLLHQRA